MALKKRILTQCSFILVGGLGLQVYASDFYTIIGPDGRPMIVQQKTSQAQRESTRSIAKDQAKEKSSGFFSKLFSSKESQKSEDSSVAQTDNRPIATQPSSPVIHSQTKSMQQNKTPSTFAVETSTTQTAQKKPQITQPHSQAITVKNKHQQSNEGNEPPSQAQLDMTSQKRLPLEQQSTNNQPRNIEAQIKSVESPQPQSAVMSAPNSKQAVSVQAPVHEANIDESVDRANTSLTAETSSQQGITRVDGVEYVDNEYLEDREFNLEGKKRFYIMSDSSVGGSRRFETIEREKGISKSVFSKFLKNPSVNAEPIVLAQTYYRIPKAEVEANLEQSCFTGKKIEKAKILSQDKDELGIWPVPPIKERFVYDVVQLDQSVENIHFTSYASSQKAPTYYWPLVVFLDQQGCVIEGVSGFKNQNMSASHFQHSALEGVLKKPTQAKYMFMTPLAEAVDVQDVQLSNQGQIKLSVLR